MDWGKGLFRTFMKPVDEIWAVQCYQQIGTKMSVKLMQIGFIQDFFLHFYERVSGEFEFTPANNLFANVDL